MEISFIRWISEQWVVQAMDHGTIEGAMDGASDGSGSIRRSDGFFKQ
jgi:hypothetical protein